MPLATVLGAIFNAIGSIAGGGFAASSASRTKKMQIDWEREAAEMERKAIEEENARRSAEAQHRAAKLEDVVRMFEGLDFGEGSDFMNRFDSMSRGGGNLTADTGALDATAGRLANLNFDDLRGLADLLASTDDSADLRKSAMHELDRNSRGMNAMLAQAGVFGSGFGAGQQRGLATDTMMGLARDISQNRYQNLMGAGSLRQGAHGLDINALNAAGGLYGTGADLRLRAGMANDSWKQGFASLLPQLGQLQLNRISGIGDMYRDDAFGPNLPYKPPRNSVKV